MSRNVVKLLEKYAFNNQNIHKLISSEYFEKKIDHQTKEGYTALMRASQYGHTQIVLTLMDAGANLKLKNNRGLTAEKLSSEPEIETMLNAAAAMK